MTVRRKCGFIIFAAMLVLCIAAAGQSISLGDAVYAADSVSLSSAADLAELSASVSEGNNRLGEYFVLTCDIDLTEAEDFVPIGTNTPFHGTIDGNGHSVTLSLNGSAGLAFISTLGSSGTVKNLTVKGSVSGDGHVAGLVIDNSGIITECVSYVKVTNAGTGQNRSYAGGIAAINAYSGRILRCVNYGEICASFNAGGIAGNSSGTIASCVSFGTITATHSSAYNVGGVAGSVSGSVNDCYVYADMDIQSRHKSNVGGIVGQTSASQGMCNYQIAGIFSLPASGSAGEVVGRFESKSGYDFLCDGGIAFGGNDFVRAKYGIGTGYLYAPTFVTELQDGVIAIKDEHKSHFGMPLFSCGTGEAGNPFEIKTAEEWRLFASNAELYDYDGVHVALTDDIIAGTVNSVFKREAPFRGAFDGRGHTVSVTNGVKRDAVALFGYVGDGRIEDLTVTGSLIAGNAGAGVVAVVTGQAVLKDVISRCTVAADLQAGGLIGYVDVGARATIQGSSNYGAVGCTGTRGNGEVGGLVGQVDGTLTVTDSASYGTVTADIAGTYGAGGIIGSVIDGSVTLDGVHAEGRVNAKSTTYVGGFVGRITGAGELDASSLSCVAEVIGKLNVGGIIGSAGGNIKLTAFSVLSSVSGENYVGGVCGTVTGRLEMILGYFGGTIAEITGSGEAQFYRDPITHVTGSGIISSAVFYNTDTVEERSVNGTGVNSVRLSNGDLFVGEEVDSSVKALMKEAEPELFGSKYPFPKSTRGKLSSEEYLRVNYFDGVRSEGEKTIYGIASAGALENFAYLCSIKPKYATFGYELLKSVTVNRELTEITAFSGTFDGRSYAVYGLSVTSDRLEVGFLGRLSGTVKDLKILGGDFVARSDGALLGSVCGYAEASAEIIDCCSTAELNGASAKIGGIVGRNAGGRISASFFAGRINGKDVGGIVAENYGTVEDCFSSGKINGTNKAGGISAVTGDLTEVVDGEETVRHGAISRCYATGRVRGAVAGGISADASGNVSVQKAYASADVSGTSVGALFYNVDGVAAGGLSACYYNATYMSGKTAYNGVADNGRYAQTEDFFRLQGAGYFDLEGFGRHETLYNKSYDARYAPYLSVYYGKFTVGSEAYDSDIAEIILKSTELALFGTDTDSDEVAGSERNPYLISTAAQFVSVATLAVYTDFADKYFRITCDIDLNDAIGGDYAVGYFTATRSNLFRGTVYGDPENRPRVKNVRVDKAPMNENGTLVTRSYLGVFGAVGEGFLLKDIIFDGTVTGETCIGGLVGYMYKGRIEGCLSYINVTATAAEGVAGGLVASGAGEITVIGSVCAGETVGKTAYGLVAVEDGPAITVITSNSWCIVDGDRYEGTNRYSHNNGGSVIYDFGNGKLQVVDGKLNGFGFKLPADGDFKGKLINTSDEIIADICENAFYDTVVGDSTRYYCARYCVRTVAEAKAPNDENELKATELAYAALDGEYYIGQSITVTLSWTEIGRRQGTEFKNIVDVNGVAIDYVLEPSANDIHIIVTMSEDIAVESITVGEQQIRLRKIIVAVEKITDEILMFDQPTEKEYGGDNRDPQILREGASAEYYLTSGESVSEIRNAGEYRILIKLTDNRGYCGIYEEFYTVNRKKLTLNSNTSVYSSFFTTVYDKSSATRTYMLDGDTDGYGEIIQGCAEGESPAVRLTFTYASGNVGSRIRLTLTDNASLDDNYYFENPRLTFGNVGVIDKKVINVSIESGAVEGDGKVVEYMYSGMAPRINGGTYEIVINWEVLTKKGDPVPSNGYNMGDYKILPKPYNTEDEANYEIKTDADYILRIVPYVIDANRLYMRSEFFDYDGSNLTSRVAAVTSYTVPEISEGIAYTASVVAFTTRYSKYGDAPEEGVPIINAGAYYIKFVADNKNFVFDDNSELKEITVRKKSVGNISVKLYDANDNEVVSGATLTVEDRIRMDFSADEIAESQGFDGEYIIESPNYDTLYADGKWYLVPVAGALEESGDVSFRFIIKSVFATNYENRVSQEMSFFIKKKQLYGILKTNTFVFGDGVFNNLSLVYYYINSDGTVGEEIPKAQIKGLSEPTISIDNFVGTIVHAGRHAITFSGGRSDGYSFRFYSSVSLGTVAITVDPRPVTVVVEQAGGKIYGNNDDLESIEYKVTYVGGDGEVYELVSLPNGAPIEFNGHVGRTEGEDVGEYDLNAGTLTGRNNPDYDISYTFYSRYVITRREIEIAVAEGQGKEYGEKDSPIVMVPYEGSSLVRGDTMAVFDGAVIATRESGEDIGSYGYNVRIVSEVLSGLNYTVTVRDYAGNAYVISKFRPHIEFELTGKPIYGWETTDLTYRGYAENKNGNRVEGSFELYITDSEDGNVSKRTEILPADSTLSIDFIPADGNYEAVHMTRSITVGKKEVTVEVYKGDGEDKVGADGAQFTYRGEKITNKEFSYRVNGTVGGNESYNVSINLSGDVKNVTKEGFDFTVELESEYYTLKEQTRGTCYITKAVVTVTVSSGAIDFGERFTPTVSYEGFVGGETKASLTKQATVGTIPVEKGYYSIPVGGAESPNYEFVYLAGVLVINGTFVSDNGITMEGTFAPEFTVSAKVADPKTVAFEDAAEQFDKELGANKLIPVPDKMTAYVTVKHSSNFAGECRYSVEIGDIESTDKLYVKLASGEIKAVDFTLDTSSGRSMASFTSEQIDSIAVYRAKTVTEMLAGYIYLIIIAAAVIIILAVVIIVKASARKKRRNVKYGAYRSQWK